MVLQITRWRKQRRAEKIVLVKNYIPCYSLMKADIFIYILYISLNGCEEWPYHAGIGIRKRVAHCPYRHLKYSGSIPAFKSHQIK